MEVLRTNPRPCRFVRKPSKLVLKQVPWRESEAATEVGFLAQIPKRLLLSYILFALGTGLCTYVTASYAWMYGEQIKLLREWKKQNASSKADGTLVKLSIPRIHLRAMVLEDTSKQSLLLGPAHV